MNDLIVVTLLAGGMLELIRAGGGLDLIVHGLTHHIRGPRGAQMAIAALVSVANVCTANNTIAIITVGRIAKDIGDRYGVAPRKLASLLDTFSCLVQGLIPYGAQILMAAGIAGIAPTAIIPHLYYPVIMGGCALLAILFNYPKR
jgi:Na+/H+ antiporter NhaC